MLTFDAKDGELVDLIDEFSEGKVQFAYVKVRDPNTALPKNVLIAWCGEGVPERTKGYFTSHLSAVSRFLHVCYPPFVWERTISLTTMAFRATMFKLLLAPMAALRPMASFRKLQIRQVPSILLPQRLLQSPPLRSPRSQASLFSLLSGQVVAGRACLQTRNLSF